MIRNIRILEDLRCGLRYTPPVHFSSRDFEEFCEQVPTARRFVSVTFSDTRFAYMKIGRRVYTYAFYPDAGEWGWHRASH